MMRKIQTAILFVLLLQATVASAAIRLPRLLSDGVVLQRDMPVALWGWASPAEDVVVEFSGNAYRTAADSAGAWKITLAPQPAGGPHRFVVRGQSDSLVVSDVLFGEVWVCSGQSNMELPMRRVRPLYEVDIARAGNPQVRQFAVPQYYDFSTPRTDLPGGNWQSATPETVLGFSATAYFFAQEIFEKYRVPVGLIHVSLGGSTAESWMSEKALEAYPHYLAEAVKFRDRSLIQQIETNDQQRIAAWYALLRQRDAGYRNPAQPWFDPALDDSGWQTMNLPGYWADEAPGAVNGVVWFRKKFTLPGNPGDRQAAARLELGRIVDADSVFLNGYFVGTTSYQYPPRRYDIPEGVLKTGDNTLVVRVINSAGRGGFVLDKPYFLHVGGRTIDLSGTWRYRLGAVMEPLASQTFIRWKPLGLFNAMLHPLLPFRIRGVIWYQGEANTKNPEEYRSLFPDMIRDWREHWQQGDFPFLFVQLANFMEAKPPHVESNWALTREAQACALKLPNTGMAVAIDIGEWNDIHPLNKKEVGRRLVQAARTVAYSEQNLRSRGPVFQSMQVTGDTVLLTFGPTDTLRTRDGKAPGGFAIAGADGRFVWADVRLVGVNRIALTNNAVPAPLAVRYAWADNPDQANLCDPSGLPAAPFRMEMGGNPSSNSAASKGLKDFYRDYFPIGVAVTPAMLEPGPDADLILTQFNSLTAENVMKMGPIHPEEHRYNWAPADKIAAFAAQHGLRLRGHTLCWHNQTPAWFFTDSTGAELGREALLQRLRRHIQEVVGRYKGKIYAWDVVNEAVADGGDEPLRRSRFLEIIGSDYIEKAFEFAREADPDALLFYNDYNTEQPQKRERIYQLLRRLKEKGVAVDGVGLQGHWSIFEPTAAELEASILKFHELDLQVQITELDVSVYPKEHGRRPRWAGEGDARFTPEMDQKQAEHYRMLFEVFRKHKDKISGVTFWNLSDKASWLDDFPVQGRKDFPLLFDQNNQPKQAFKAIMDFEKSN